MTRARTIAVLNQLLAIHNRSFPTYLASAPPWTHRGDDKAAEVLQHIVDDQKLVVDRIGDVIVEAEAAVDMGEFPMEFTDTHDLSLDFLLGELLRYQQGDIAAIRQCVDQLPDDPLAHALGEEAWGAAKGHLESLEELVRQPSGADS